MSSQFDNRRLCQRRQLELVPPTSTLTSLSTTSASASSTSLKLMNEGGVDETSPDQLQTDLTTKSRVSPLQISPIC